jgi:transposase-like protein
VFALLEHASPTLRDQLKATADKARRGSVVVPANQRVKFSPELRERIRKELETGLKSVAEISREYGPSHPTIMGWKREWGMTKPRQTRGNGNGSSR